MRDTLALDKVAEIERFAMRAWPGLEVDACDGWILRHAAGVTRRANSVWPNAARGENPLPGNMATVEAFYHARGLPARFQICPAARPDGLDARLEESGYRAVARTAVQICPLAAMLEDLAAAPTLTVEVTPQPSSIWWDCYARADEVDPESVLIRKSICSHIEPVSAYAVVLREGEAIAVGSAVAEAGWVGFFNIATLNAYRRMGAAQAVMLMLGKWGQAAGATEAYLQVMVDNDAALRLYSRLGFVTGYFYHYREECGVF